VFEDGSSMRAVDVTRHESVGHGQFGVVYRGEARGPPIRDVAIKVMALAVMNRDAKMIVRCCAARAL
jgi:hypothetical protein